MEADSAAIEGAGSHDSDVIPDTMRLDGNGPLWAQIRRALLLMITERAWLPGARIPSEIALTAHFAASRMTVNKAIQSLASEGLLARRRRIGTIVADRAQERAAFEIWDIEDIITRSGATYSYRLLEQAIVNDHKANRGMFEVGRELNLLWMRCLHLADDRPFQLEKRLVNMAAAPGIVDQSLKVASAGRWLLAKVPWTRADHAISALEAGQQEAAQLAIRRGAACLVVERRTWNRQVPVTLAQLWHPGARHRLTGGFEPVR